MLRKNTIFLIGYRFLWFKNWPRYGIFGQPQKKNGRARVNLWTCWYMRTNRVFFALRLNQDTIPTTSTRLKPLMQNITLKNGYFICYKLPYELWRHRAHWFLKKEKKYIKKIINIYKVCRGAKIAIFQKWGKWEIWSK